MTSDEAATMQIREIFAIKDTVHHRQITHMGIVSFHDEAKALLEE